MVRTPQQVFQHHAEALAAGDLDEIVADYTDDATFICAQAVHHGRPGIRRAYARLISELPDARWDYLTQVYDSDLLLVEWTADAGRSRVEDGIDTYVLRDGKIRAQTVRYTLLRARGEYPAATRGPATTGGVRP